jgi:hypothetical protein
MDPAMAGFVACFENLSTILYAKVREHGRGRLDRQRTEGALPMVEVASAYRKLTGFRQ